MQPPKIVMEPATNRSNCDLPLSLHFPLFIFLIAKKDKSDRGKRSMLGWWLAGIWQGSEGCSLSFDLTLLRRQPLLEELWLVQTDNLPCD